jgi:tagatose-6-phosphate ketose/aldose isomerase
MSTNCPPLPTLSDILALPEHEQVSLGGMHTAKEIAQQPETWRSTLRTMRDAGERLARDLERAGVFSHDPPSFLLLGAGTSDYIGRSAEGLLRRGLRCHVSTVPSTDLCLHAEDLLVPGQKYASVSFSRSGNSPESVASLRLMLERFPTSVHFVVTCDESGRMAREFGQHQAASLLLLPAETNDRGLAMTSSFTNMLVAAQCLAGARDVAKVDALLQPVANAAAAVLPAAEELARREAERGFSRVCFLGSGTLYGIARESALKVLELTAGRAPSLSETFLGVRHGPLSALDPEALVVGYLSSDPERRRHELELLEEVQRKGVARRVIAVATGERPTSGPFDDLLSLDVPRSVSSDHAAPAFVLFAQLLGFYASLRFGLHPDQPSPGGVINRVVTGVRL